MLKPDTSRSICALLLALCLLSGALPAMGQSQASSGQIAGSVTDSLGAAIGGATVKVTNTQTGLERTVTTSEDGLYRAVLLPPGVYSVTAEASGFASATVDAVEVVVGRTTDINLTLGASGVQEVVNVTAGAVQVQTTRPEADAVLNEKAIENLPINGRRFQDFVTLTPGAQVDPRRGQISLSGQLGIHSNVNIDGVDYNQPFFGGIRGGERSNNAFTVPQESIKEFQVVASGYTAEFGRSTGGIVNAVTKSGTNDLHGSAFFLARPKGLSKDNLFIDAIELQLSNQTAPTGAGLKDVDAAPTQYQFGGSIGGPIKKDKIFFFGSYEQQRLRQDREVFFDLLSGFTPTAATQEAFDFYTSLQETYEQTNDAVALLGRIDYEVSQNHRFNIRYSFSDNEAKNATSNGVPLFPTITNALSNNGTEKDRIHAVVGQMASFFGANIVNELRGQYSHERRPRPANALSPTVESAIGNFGTVSFLGQNEQFDWRFQIADSVTWTKGNHTVKFGGEYNHIFADQTFGFNQFGRFQISGSSPATILDILGVGGSTANRFDSTAVTYLRQIGNLRLEFDTDETAFFAQDSWRIRPNLTLNYGLRWEAQYNPEPELGNDALINLVRGFPFPSGHRVDPTRIPDDDDNFGPRVGFAWDPFSDTKTVIRGYGGIYYSRTPGLLLAAPLNNFRGIPGDLSVQLPLAAAPGNPNASANTVYKQLLLIGIDLNDFSLGNLPVITPEQIQQLAAMLGAADPLTAGVQPILMANDYENPQSTQAGIGIERELGRGLTVGADFTYINTSHLQQNRDLNIPKPLIRPTDPAQRPFYGLRSPSSSPFRQVRPIPTLGSVQVRESTGRSLYRALTLRTKFQRSWGQFNAFYVLSKALSTTDNEREAGGVQYEDAFNTGPEYGPSNLDRRHQFTLNPVFNLPYGFDVSSAVRLRSGRPIDASFGSDANEDRGGPDRPYLGPGVPFTRNSFRNRALYDIDLRVQKRFQLGETSRFIFSWEIFNVLNLENIELDGSAVTRFCNNAPNSSAAPADCGFFAPTNPNFLQLRDRNPTSTRFGQLLLNNRAGNPFQMQIGARFQF
ncbi:MAG TPA: carboxypeptidase regulatory-like domain-containing protein [Blastocatellia bacterium]|nr:carboxypeptidase regulatory-like domain-containing protein [Blastocatellia bacterium]